MDAENATKAMHTANLLRKDLQELSKSDDRILAEYALHILERFAPIERELMRLHEIVE